MTALWLAFLSGVHLILTFWALDGGDMLLGMWTAVFCVICATASINLWRSQCRKNR